MHFKMVPCGSRCFRLLYVNMLYSIQANSFSIIKNSKTFKMYAFVHNKMEEVQLKAKA